MCVCVFVLRSHFSLNIILFVCRAFVYRYVQYSNRANKKNKKENYYYECVPGNFYPPPLFSVVDKIIVKKFSTKKLEHQNNNKTSRMKIHVMCKFHPFT